MKNEHRIVLSTKKIEFEVLTLNKVTLLQGDSGTGKSVFMKYLALSMDKSLGIKVDCDIVCAVLPDNCTADTWKNYLSYANNTIIFIDDYSTFVHTKEFAEFIKGDNNYYVIATRENLQHIPDKLCSIQKEIKITVKNDN